MNNNQPRTNYGGSFFRANPVMNRVTKITERGAEGSRAGYGGVAMKTGFFLLMTVVGVIGYLVAQITVFQYQPQIEGLMVLGSSPRVWAMQNKFIWLNAALIRRM